MIRVCEGVYSWSHFSEEKGLNFNGLLVACREGAVVVDPPPHSPSDEAFLVKKLKSPPVLAVVTNKHHLRDVLWWLERFRVPLAMHEAETNDYGFEVGRKLKDGETVAGELRVAHLPGKTPGEIALYLERDGGTLIVGDALIGEPMGGVKLIPREKIQDLGRLQESLQRLRSLSFERLLVGDGEPILYAAKPRVAEFLDSLPKPARRPA